VTGQDKTLADGVNEIGEGKRREEYDGEDIGKKRFQILHNLMV
jgi:hypothetical protein